MPFGMGLSLVYSSGANGCYELLGSSRWRDLENQPASQPLDLIHSHKCGLALNKLSKQEICGFSVGLCDVRR